jgi:hypothetical protein
VYTLHTAPPSCGTTKNNTANPFTERAEEIALWIAHNEEQQEKEGKKGTSTAAE